MMLLLETAQHVQPFLLSVRVCSRLVDRGRRYFKYVDRVPVPVFLAEIWATTTCPRVPQGTRASPLPVEQSMLSTRMAWHGTCMDGRCTYVRCCLLPRLAIEIAVALRSSLLFCLACCSPLGESTADACIGYLGRPETRFLSPPPSQARTFCAVSGVDPAPCTALARSKTLSHTHSLSLFFPRETGCIPEETATT